MLADKELRRGGGGEERSAGDGGLHCVRWTRKYADKERLPIAEGVKLFSDNERRGPAWCGRR